MLCRYAHIRLLVAFAEAAYSVPVVYGSTPPSVVIIESCSALLQTLCLGTAVTASTATAPHTLRALSSLLFSILQVRERVQLQVQIDNPRYFVYIILIFSR